MHTRPLCGTQVGDKARLRPRFCLFLQKAAATVNSLKCLLHQAVLRMSANYTFLIFMFPFLLLSFVSALSSFISCSGNYLTPDVFWVFFNVLLLQ